MGTITRCYYRGAHGILFVYDITDRDSFENIKYWFSDMNRLSSPHARKILIGNKSDLGESRQVSYDEGLEVASNLGIEFMEASAKTSHNVEKAFLTMANEIKADVVDASWESSDEKNLVIISEPIVKK